MSQEIYYTSAAEGLKPGTRGFCTVAATEGLPKPLWDRLESLSAYRHHFPAGSGQTNPTAYAHWIVTLAGKEYHALSRVADSGMDYTQRTNSFAHHLVVDASEMAQAGPAWMLRQPGVMATSWDGRVGPIVRSSPLPNSSAGPAPCNSWAAVAGDAGYAGLLAESAAKNPHRPVCILFSPGMDLLPLIDEVLRLLPVPLRWQVSFSTYFTSAPTTVLCAWRCCLAGTPAAEQGRRYAGAGLFMDLTGGKLPPLVESPWTVLARTGIPVAVAAPKATLTKQPPPPPPPMKKPEGPKPEWTKGSTPATTSPGVSPRNYEPAEPLELAEQPAAIGPRFSEEDLAAYNNLIAEAEARAGAAQGGNGYKASGLIQVDAPGRQSGGKAEEEKLKKASTLAVGLLAAAAVGVVITLAVILMRKPEEVPVVEQPRTRPPEVVVTPETKPATKPVVVVNVPDVKGPEVVVVPTDTRPVEVPPALVVLKKLEWPKGMASKAQVMELPKEVEQPEKIAKLSIQFANERSDTTIQVAGQDATLMAVAEASRPAVGIRWKNKVSSGILAYLEIKAGKLEIAWQPGELMKTPEAAVAAYWLLTRATMRVGDAKMTRPQPIQFTPIVIEGLSLSDATSTITWPVEVPPGAILQNKGTLPEGWTALWLPGWDLKDPAPSPEKAFQILRFKKPIEGVADAAFELTVRDRLTQVESNLVKRIRQTESDLADLESQLKDKDGAAADKLKPFETALDNAKNDVALADAELKAKGLDRKRAQANLDKATTDLDAQKQKLTAALGDTARILEEKRKLVAGYRLAIDAYRDIKTVEIEVLMPDKTPIVTLKFER